MPRPPASSFGWQPRPRDAGAGAAGGGRRRAQGEMGARGRWPVVASVLVVRGLRHDGMAPARHSAGAWGHAGACRSFGRCGVRLPVAAPPRAWFGGRWGALARGGAHGVRLMERRRRPSEGGWTCSPGGRCERLQGALSSAGATVTRLQPACDWPAGPWGRAAAGGGLAGWSYADGSGSAEWLWLFPPWIDRSTYPSRSTPTPHDTTHTQARPFRPPPTVNHGQGEDPREPGRHRPRRRRQVHHDGPPHLQVR